MLLNSVIIVAREVLEAALLLSVLLALSRFLRIGTRWCIVALGAGFAGAAIYGFNMQAVSGLFDGVGQEVTDAALQYAVFLLLAVTVFCMAARPRLTDAGNGVLPVLMAVVAALALIREGAEILIYVIGFSQMERFLASVGIGSLIGAGIGVSVGVLFYYLLLVQPRRRGVAIGMVLLALIGAAMCAQATRLLIQADWLSVAGPLWDTSGVLREDSMAGQLLYALIGYEATPSAKEVIVYGLSLVVMLSALLTGRRTGGKPAFGETG